VEQKDSNKYLFALMVSFKEFSSTIHENCLEQIKDITSKRTKRTKSKCKMAT